MAILRFKEYIDLYEQQNPIQQGYQLAKSPYARSFISGVAQNQLNPDAANADSNTGALQSPDKQVALDALQATLDVAGIEPSYGTVADGVNALISAGRAFADPYRRGEHLSNTLINIISMIPMADIVKLLKLNKMRGTARGVTKAGQIFGKPIQDAARSLKQDRISKAPDTLANYYANRK